MQEVLSHAKTSLLMVEEQQCLMNKKGVELRN
jgi:hypothetical protein